MLRTWQLTEGFHLGRPLQDQLSLFSQCRDPPDLHHFKTICQECGDLARQAHHLGEPASGESPREDAERKEGEARGIGYAQRDRAYWEERGQAEGSLAAR